MTNKLTPIPTTVTPMPARVRSTLLAALRVFVEEVGASVEADDAKAWVQQQGVDNKPVTEYTRS